MGIVMPHPEKGARISDFYPVKEVPPLASLDSAFQLQEYISLLIRHDVHDVETIVSIPGKQGTKEREGSDDMIGEEDKELGKSDVVVDESCWIYEQLRRLAQDLSHPLITTLQQECTRATCPEMKAGEWLYLCVAHGNDGSMEQCCAIDYILHTLDSATALLNSPRAFPSRLSIPPTSQRHFPSLARRLGRIFAHAYYHHREAFEQAEAESSLYARFLALTGKFNLVPAEFLVIPSSMQGMHEEEDQERDTDTRNKSETYGIGSSQDTVGRQWLAQIPSSSATDLSLDNGRGTSPSGPADEARNPSPRKGRSRTDTMVYSDASNVVEELARGQPLTETALSRAIAQERMLTVQGLSFSDLLVKEGQEEQTAVPPEAATSDDTQESVRYPDDNVPRDIDWPTVLPRQMESESTEPAVTAQPAEQSNVVAEPAVQPEAAPADTAQPPEPEQHAASIATVEQDHTEQATSSPEEPAATETQQEDQTKTAPIENASAADKELPAEPAPEEGSPSEDVDKEDVDEEGVDETSVDVSDVISSDEPEQPVIAEPPQEATAAVITDESEPKEAAVETKEEGAPAEKDTELAPEPSQAVSAPAEDHTSPEPSSSESPSSESSDIRPSSEVQEEHSTSEDSQEHS